MSVIISALTILTIVNEPYVTIHLLEGFLQRGRGLGPHYEGFSDKEDSVIVESLTPSEHNPALCERCKNSTTVQATCKTQSK